MTDDSRAGSEPILASGGDTLQRLSLVSMVPGDGAVLVDVADIPANPWEVELRHWPLEAEPASRRGGYPRDRSPDLELWCNCVD